MYSGYVALLACVISLTAAGLVGYSRLTILVAVLKSQVESLQEGAKAVNGTFSDWQERLVRIEENTKRLLAKIV